MDKISGSLETARYSSSSAGADNTRKNDFSGLTGKETKPLEKSVYHAKAEYKNTDSSTEGIEELNQRLNQALDKKEYIHWESPEAREHNRKIIDDYDAKKRAVDRASLLTQKDILTRYQGCFDREAIARMHSELGSNKTEIYNEPYFTAKMAPDTDAYKVVGVRDVRDGKICIRDNNNTDTLIHTSTHETMHDLSYQNADQIVSHTSTDKGDITTVSTATNASGIFRLETTRTILPDGKETEKKRETNRYLNEGLTELYTIESMQQRGESPRFDSYTQEMGWALQLREKVGEDQVAKAYFGGELAQLRDRVNSMSSLPDAWEELNENINAYHQSVSAERPAGDLKLKETVDNIIAGLQGTREYGSRRMR